MQENKAIKAKGWRLLAGVLACALSGAVPADTFAPYPGKREVTVARVEAPNLIFVTFDTDATGFFRTLGITMPGIVVAQDTPRADGCEREAAARALGFVQDFLAGAGKIYVQDMQMENSADEQALAPILTDKGSLSAAMIQAGVARPDSVDPTAPWCN